MPTIMRLLALVAVTAATIQPPATARSAAINGEITGTVTDPSGAAIPGAVIQISNPATRLQTRNQGSRVGLNRFTLPLPLGTYDLLGQAVGFADAPFWGDGNAGATVRSTFATDRGREHRDRRLSVNCDHRPQPNRPQ